MKKVYICSPLRGDIDENIRKARLYSEYAIKECGVLPITPHIYFTQFLDDNVESDRELGIQAGMQLLDECEELWVFGDTISEGMMAEIARAGAAGKTIKYFEDFDLNFDNQVKMGGM